MHFSWAISNYMSGYEAYLAVEDLVSLWWRSNVDWGSCLTHSTSNITATTTTTTHLTTSPPFKGNHQTALKRDVMVSTLESLHLVSSFMDCPPNPTGTKEVSTFNAFNVDLDGSWFVSLLGDGCSGMPNLKEVVLLISWGCLSG